MIGSARSRLALGVLLVIGCAGDGDADRDGTGDGDGDGDGGSGSLRFFGGGVDAPDADRLKIRIDDPEDNLPGPPADVGAEDFTIEFWLRDGGGNDAGPAACGDNIAWIYGNIVVDRDRYAQDRKFGLSIAGGRLVFGVSGDGSGDATLCGNSDVLDEEWHHVAIQRRRADGRMWLFVDGLEEAEGVGPTGDVSYPDDGVPTDNCNGPCVDSDPFFVFAAEKHDAGADYPSFSGWLAEIRFSRVLRYDDEFELAVAPFDTDADTVALYHLDEGEGTAVGDASDAPGGPSDGLLLVGGDPEGPQWSLESPW